jgi:hypothetical protein
MSQLGRLNEEEFTAIFGLDRLMLNSLGLKTIDFAAI